MNFQVNDLVFVSAYGINGVVETVVNSWVLVSFGLDRSEWIESKELTARDA
jgi:hypothetical protein